MALVFTFTTDDLILIGEALYNYEEELTEGWRSYGFKHCDACGSGGPDGEGPCDAHENAPQTAGKVRVLLENLNAQLAEQD